MTVTLMLQKFVVEEVCSC